MDFFSRPCVLIKGPMFIIFVFIYMGYRYFKVKYLHIYFGKFSMPYVYSSPYVHYSFFLTSFPEPTFIPYPTSIMDSRVSRLRDSLKKDLNPIGMLAPRIPRNQWKFNLILQTMEFSGRNWLNCHSNIHYAFYASETGIRLLRCRPKRRNASLNVAKRTLHPSFNSR